MALQFLAFLGSNGVDESPRLERLLGLVGISIGAFRTFAHRSTGQRVTKVLKEGGRGELV